MRQLLFIAALAFLAAPLAQAQVTFGVKGGLNTAFWTGADSDGTDPRLGAAAGLVARYSLNPGFGIQAEALYSQKGVTSGSGGGTFNRTTRLDYVEIPVMARVALPAAQFLNVGLMAGPSIGLPVRATTQGGVGGSTATATTDVSARTDLGLAVGADIGSGPFAVDVRYTLGQTRPINEPLYDPNVRNQNFNVSFVYLFGR